MTVVNFKPTVDTNDAESTYMFYDQTDLLLKHVDNVDKPNINVTVPDADKAFSVLLNVFSGGCNVGLVNGAFYVNGFVIDEADPVTVISVACTNTDEDLPLFTPDEVLVAPDVVAVTGSDGVEHTLGPVNGLVGVYAVYGLDPGEIHIKVERTGFEVVDETLQLYDDVPLNFKVLYYGGQYAVAYNR